MRLHLSRSTGTVLLFLVLLLLPGAVWAADPPDAPRKARICLSRDFFLAADPKDALAVMQAWAELAAPEMAKDGVCTGVDVFVAPPVEDMAREFEDGSLFGAYVTSYEYVRLRELTKVEPFATVLTGGRIDGNRTALVVAADNPAKTIADLKGKTFAYLGETSTRSYLFPQWLLFHAGQPEVKEFFGRTILVGKEKSAIYAVILGEADVTTASCVTLDLLKELSPGIRAKLKVLTWSRPLPDGVFVVRAGAEPKVLKSLRRCLFDHKRLGAKLTEMLRYFKFGDSSLCKAEDHHFEQIREIVRILDARQKRHLDPICGARLTDEEVHCSVELGAVWLRFCSEKCREKYQEHCRRSSPGAEDPLIVMGLMLDRRYDRSLREALATAQLVHQDLRELYALDIRLELLPSLEVARARLAAGTMNVVQTDAPNYVELAREVELSPIARVQYADEFYQACLLVDARKGFGGFESLRGSALAVPRDADPAQEIYLLSLIGRFGLRHLPEFFGRVLRCPSEESALKAVAFGQADCALLGTPTYQTLSELSPGVCRHLTLLDLSEALMAGPLCHVSDLAPETARKLRHYLQQFHERPRGREMLRYFKCQRMVPAEDSDYEGIRRMMKELNR